MGQDLAAMRDTRFQNSGHPVLVPFGSLLSLFLALQPTLTFSRAGPQTRCFGLSPENNSDFAQGLICKILSYGRIFLQIFILL